MRTFDDTERPLQPGERCLLMCECPRDPADVDLFVTIVAFHGERSEGIRGPWYAIAFDRKMMHVRPGETVLARRGALLPIGDPP